MSEIKAIVGYYPPKGFLAIKDYSINDGSSNSPHKFEADVTNGLSAEVENALVNHHAKYGDQNDVLLLEIHEDGETEHAFVEMG